MTAYRQDALLCAAFLDSNGPSAPVKIKQATGIARARQLLYDNVYGWFARPATGTYHLTDAGRQALQEYAVVVTALQAPIELGQPVETADSV